VLLNFFSMCSPKQIMRIALAGGLLCGLLPCSNRTWASDDVVADDASSPPRASKLTIRELPPNADDAQSKTPVDQWLFQRSQAAGIRTNMEAAATRQLDELKRRCNLSDAQTKRLALAVERDVNQFLEDVERLRAGFPDSRALISEEMENEVMRLHAKFRAGGGSLCGPGSFFDKMLPRVLDDEQLASYRVIVDARLRERYLTAVDVALQDLEDRVPLDSRQHAAIRRSLVERSLPHASRKWKDLTPLVMFRLAQISADQLQPLFDDRHWTAFDRYRLPGRSYRDSLQLIGLLPENE
jgi:hypothetical protein